MRASTKRVMVGKVAVGGGAPVSVQSMLCAPCGDIAANIEQAKELEAAGCDIVRVAVPDHDGVRLIGALKDAVDMPVVADIHFDYRLALESVAAGADKIRINPGNIGAEDRVKQVADACRRRGVPIRVGVNSGSLEQEQVERYGRTPEAMVESALRHVEMLERHGFYDIVVALKSSDVAQTVAAYRLMSRRCEYPLHLGVTEAGTERMGTIKSAVAIGSLLLDGIGDTLRVSLSASPVREVAAARDILKVVGMGGGLNIISCPTCGRCKIDVLTLAGQVEQALGDIERPLTVAVMGCEVNGPGEASHADFGVAGGDGEGLLFAGGKTLRKVPADRILSELVDLAKSIAGNP